MSLVGGNTLLLNGEWQIWKTDPGSVSAPAELSEKARDEFTGTVPGSLYHSLSLTGRGQLDGDDYDWWYGIDFAADALPLALALLLSKDTPEQPTVELYLDRLATLSEIWLNGQLIATHQNFFLPLQLDVSHQLREHNELRLCFRSVTDFLARKRPRPRWKTNLVSHQQLRWLRTSLLGRIPSWEPHTPATGPCGDIELRVSTPFSLTGAHIKTLVSDGAGIIDVDITTRAQADSLELVFGDVTIPLLPSREGKEWSWQGKKALQNPRLWWPHTHGEPCLYDLTLRITAGARSDEISLGKHGFRTVELDTENETCFRVNEKPVFARGACWTLCNPQRFWSSEAEIREMLEFAKSAGMNMLRVGGTMQYEQDCFYRICDELGILVWQDFMFANMDYPEEAGFLDNVREEVVYQLTRLSGHTCIAVYCGNSEAQQQAAMMGQTREHWCQPMFSELIPQLCEQLHPGVPYVASSPSGGGLPFHIGTGIAHFYGVGAYQKPILSSGADRVRFASETLGFSNVPVRRQWEALFQGAAPMCHSALWKKGVPRDNGAGLDFEDVRDSYFDMHYSQLAVEQRKTDTVRYLEMSSVLPGELIKQVFGLWRTGSGRCGGALIWFYRDLFPGAGWGVLDSAGCPKPVYFQLKRAFATLACFILDLGLDGMEVCLVNEGSSTAQGKLHLKLIKSPDKLIENQDLDVEVPPGAVYRINIEETLGVFRDVTYSYRFGSRAHDMVAAAFIPDNEFTAIAQDVFFVGNWDLPLVASAEVSITAAWSGENLLELTLLSAQCLQWVSIEAGEAEISDQFFHLLPGCPVKLGLTLKEPADKVKGVLHALNLAVPVRFKIKR